MPCGSTFPYAAGETLFVTSTTRPSTFPDLQLGRRIVELDTGRELYYDGTGWVVMSEPLQTFNTFSVTSGTGAITTVGAKSGWYKRGDGFCDFSFNAPITTNGTGSGYILIGLPVVAGAGAWAGSGRGNAVSGKQLQLLVSGATVLAFNYDNTYPGASGETLTGSIRYPMTTRYS